MKKILMMLVFTVFTVIVFAQRPENKERYWREMDSLPCRGTENLEECKARLRRERIERERYQDSVKREQEFLMNKWSRERWAKEKARRDTLTPEERRQEDVARRLGFEADKKKKGELEIDFLAGAIYSRKTGNPPYDPVLGALLGAQAQAMSISDNIGLGIGINFSMQGGKYESSEYIPGGNYSKTSRTSRLNYLNFPLLLRYRKARDGFFAEAGLQPGLLLSAKDKGTNTNDIKEDVKKFDVGIPLGIGYKFKNKVGVGLRVTPGLINVNKDEQYKNRNMVASLRASYSL